MPQSAARTTTPSLWSLCLSLAEEARDRHEVPASIVEQAKQATLRRMHSFAEGSLSDVECARIRAYFWTVVRRRALRNASASRFIARVVRESIAEDLRRAGFGQDRIARELERCGA